MQELTALTHPAMSWDPQGETVPTEVSIISRNQPPQLLSQAGLRVILRFGLPGKDLTATTHPFGRRWLRRSPRHNL